LLGDSKKVSFLKKFIVVKTINFFCNSLFEDVIMVKFLKHYGVILPSMFFDWLCVSWSVVRGFWVLSKIPEPRITFFGGARVLQNSPYAEGARELARRLVELDSSIITGGGPGIMQAANWGAFDAAIKQKRKRSLGISVVGLAQEPFNKYTQEHIMLKYFFARKYLLINYSIGFVVFPGGFGTVDEFAEVLTLIQTKKLKHVPVILFNSSYWQPFMDWVYNSAVSTGLLSAEHANLLTITDDFEEVFCLLRDRCDVFRNRTKI
jgi:uncharacterized protein (TIGR00730 family)